VSDMISRDAAIAAVARLADDGGLTLNEWGLMLRAILRITALPADDRRGAESICTCCPNCDMYDSCWPNGCAR